MGKVHAEGTLNLTTGNVTEAPLLPSAVAAADGGSLGNEEQLAAKTSSWTG